MIRYIVHHLKTSVFLIYILSFSCSNLVAFLLEFIVYLVKSWHFRAFYRTISVKIYLLVKMVSIFFSFYYVFYLIL